MQCWQQDFSKLLIVRSNDEAQGLGSQNALIPRYSTCNDVPIESLSQFRLYAIDLMSGPFLNHGKESQLYQLVVFDHLMIVELRPDLQPDTAPF